MNYQRIYDSIISNRLHDPYIGYTEEHHIIPRSFGGSDNGYNLVKLSAREHFMCHLLLTKIHKNDIVKFRKMIKAFIMMLHCKSTNQNRHSPSRLYEMERKKFSEVMREMQTGEKNSQYGKMWIYNITTKENTKIYATENIPDGWIKGRVIEQKKMWICSLSEGRDKKVDYSDTIPDGWCRGRYTDSKANPITKTKRVLQRRTPKEVRAKKKIVSDIVKVNKLREYYEIYSKVGFCKFVELTEYKYSAPNLVAAFGRHLPEFVPQNGKKRK